VPHQTSSQPVEAVRAATILLVVDEELVREGTADMLVDLGYSVVQAGSGAQASEMMRTGLRPDLLITDYAMPSMTGVELARNVRSRAPHMPVLLITGYANLSDDEAARLPRHAKPFRQADLAAAIAELLQGNVIKFQRPSSGPL
jgi:CheY-like chemotaxis protein